MATGCGGTEPTPSATSPAATSAAPSATPNAGNAGWAESVCGAAVHVRSSLDAIGSNLTFNPAAGKTAREQIENTLTTQVAAARTSISDLGAAIQAIPVDAQGGTELRNSLTASRNSLNDAVQAVSAGVQDVKAAANTKDLLTASAQTLQAVKAAKSSAQAFLTTTKEVTTTAGGQLKAAVDAAPSCARPSSTSS